MLTVDSLRELGRGRRRPYVRAKSRFSKMPQFKHSSASVVASPPGGSGSHPVNMFTVKKWPAAAAATGLGGDCCQTTLQGTGTYTGSQQAQQWRHLQVVSSFGATVPLRSGRGVFAEVGPLRTVSVFSPCRRLQSPLLLQPQTAVSRLHCATATIYTITIVQSLWYFFAQSFFVFLFVFVFPVRRGCRQLEVEAAVAVAISG